MLPGHGLRANSGPVPRMVRRPLPISTLEARPGVWPFSDPWEPATVYERVVLELDRLEGQAWRAEPDHYRWAA